MSPRDRESTQYARLISARRARRRHVGYQTLINEVLAQHVRTDVAWTRGKPQLHRSEIAHSYGVFQESPGVSADISFGENELRTSCNVPLQPRRRTAA